MEIFRSLLLLIGSCCFTFVLFEGGFRAFLLAQGGSSSLEQDLKRSQELAPVEGQGNVSLAGLIFPSRWHSVVYELKPNLTVNFQGQPLHTNGFGMRQSDLSLEKPDRIKRIVGIGDSVMFGWGVAEEESYLRLLEKSINGSLEQKVEVLNFGVPGFNTAMEVALFEHKALPFQPDLVVLHFVSNDFDVPAFMMKREDPFDLSQSFIVKLLRERISKPSNKLVHAHHVLTSKKNEYDDVIEEYRSMAGYSAAKDALAHLHELTTKKGVPVIVIYGALNRSQRKLLKLSAESYNWQLLPLGGHVEKALAKYGIPNTPEARKRHLTVAPNDRHPSALGHKIVAEALIETVTPLLQGRVRN